MNTKQDARKLDLYGKEDLRRRVIQAVTIENVSVTQAARLFGVSRTSVFNWCKLYRNGGEDALTPKRPGRPKGGGQLSPKQAAKIRAMIRDRTPDQLKFPFALWTREAVRELIKKLFGVDYSLNMVGVLLADWGFTPQKPVVRSLERNDEAIRKWLEVDYPKIKKRAKREKAEIYWEDETGLRSDHQTGRTYSPAGKTPIIRGTGKRFSCNIISAINNRGRMRFQVFKGGFNQLKMIDFLERLIRYAGHKVIVIADGHPAHRGRKLKSWLEQRPSQIELITLPGYAPKLNPDEMLNQDLKRGVFKTRRPHTQGEMISQTRTFLRATQKQVERVRSYFREAHVAYAG
jgi:transposase